MSQLLDLDLALLRVLGEQFPYKQFASFNEKAGHLYILPLTCCVQLGVCGPEFEKSPHHS